MTGKDLFVGLNYIDQKYINEAENGVLKKKAEITIVKPEQKPKKRPRLLLIAAIVALMLLLAGCVAAVFMGLRERTIVTEERTREETQASFDVITLFGYTGTPQYQALQEWYAFTESYDQDLELMTNTNELGIPENYWYSYFCYTWDMVEKLEDILEKYDLKALGKEAVVQTWDTDIFYEALQIDSLIRSDSGMDITSTNGYFYPEGAFSVDLTLNPAGETPRWNQVVYADLMYCPKDYFCPRYSSVQSEIYDEWLYTTAQGIDVNIATRQDSAVFFAEQEDAYLTAFVTMNPYDQKDPAVRADIEAMAEVFDFTICPKVPENMEDIRQRLADSMTAWEAQQEENRKLGGSFAEYMCSQYTEINNKVYYAFHDINNDDVQDLLLGDKNGNFFKAMTINEGSVVELYNTDSFHIDENGFIMSTLGYGTQKTWYYVRLEGYDPYGLNAAYAETVTYDDSTGSWTCREGTNGAGDVEVTEAEARAVMEKYTAMEIPVYPIMSYPVDEAGTTLEAYIEDNRVVLTKEERMALYRDYVKKEQESAFIPSTHYMLMDVNGDGQEELLLTYDVTYARNIMTINKGELSTLYMWTSISPCENNIWEKRNREDHHEYHYYFTIDMEGEHHLDYVYYNPEDNSWRRDADGDNYLEETITKEQYDAIVASYKPLTMDWIPIDQFPAE